MNDYKTIYDKSRLTTDDIHGLNKTLDEIISKTSEESAVAAREAATNAIIAAQTALDAAQTYVSDHTRAESDHAIVYGYDTRLTNVEDEVSQLGQEINGFSLVFEAGYINSSGELVPPDGYSQCVSQIVPVSIANGLVISFNKYLNVFRLVYYNGETFVSRSSSFTESPATIETEYSVRIVLMTASSGTSYSVDEMVAAYTFTGLPTGLKDRVQALEQHQGDIDALSEKVSVLDTEINGISLVWKSGSIDAYGEEAASTQSNYISQLLDKDEINGVALTASAGFQWNIAFYNHDTGVFVNRFGWNGVNSGRVVISTNNDAIIMIALSSGGDNTKSAEYVSSGITIENLDPGLEKRVEALEGVSDKSDYLSKIMACDFDGKILHFSFDDTCWCIYDLIQNANTYESIFDEPFFGMLKEIHDATGMVFTLNTFNEIATNTSGYYPTGFDISDVPTKFQGDFQANKGWIKFAFHAKDENTNYDTASGAGTDYGVFVSAIYTLTGDYDCIDHITRLGYFGGTKENCLALRDAEHGIIGFFGADDTRAYDYYLSADQYAWLRKKGKYFDGGNKILFIKTQYRTLTTGEQDVENNFCFQKVTEFFAHEYEANTGGVWNLTSMKNKILALATWATGLGYKFEYPEKIYG